MRRRNFIALLGGAAAWPLAARAQQSATPVLGILHGGSAAERAHLIAAFRQALGAAGYVEGQNVMIEYRWADEQFDRLPLLAADLVRRRVSVIAIPAGSVAAVAAKAATTTIPIVFGSENDPIKAGLATSFNRPSDNATGVYFLSGGLVEKRFGLIRELMPGAELVGLLINPNNPLADATRTEVLAAASAVGQQVEEIGRAHV